MISLLLNFVTLMMTLMENINDKLSKKILTALIADDIILDESAIRMDNKFLEGKIKDQDWIIVFTQKYNSTLLNDDETK